MVTGRICKLKRLHGARPPDPPPYVDLAILLKGLVPGWGGAGNKGLRSFVMITTRGEARA
jgi:hypothetical protein